MIYDVVIVGAGIAGLTAAIYAGRAGKKVLVLEEKIAGGQIMTSSVIKNYPGFKEISGAELMTNVKQQAMEFGAEIQYGEVTEIVDGENEKRVKTNDDEYVARAVILAIGREEEKLDVPGAELPGVSYCATCDGELCKGKKVAVIGGGNTALYDALYLSELAEKVYLVHRRNEFRGEARLVENLKMKKNVEFVMEAEVTEILGEDRVQGFRALPCQGRDVVYDVDGVFVAIGQRPKTERFRGLVDLDEKGYVVAGEDCRTSCPGIYVAGDCRTKNLRQLVTAAADGAIAASEICQKIK